MAALLLPYIQDPEQSFFRVAGILLPLLLISYLTYKTALGKSRRCESTFERTQPVIPVNN